MSQMKQIAKQSAILCLTLAMSLTTMLAFAADDWITIAEKTVDYKAEVDTVKPHNSEKKVDSIKLKCTQGTVNLKQVVINMKDGESKSVDNLGVLTEGMSSRAISVPKGESTISSIELSYDSVGNQKLGLVGVSKKGKIEVLGRKADDKSD
ncbi:hypothetical protein [Shewanella sp. Isolate11]|uniref:DUF2541 family protein n=1 Tax=Shewanella sp. Isolate11 TaxID=2908530 RepID=UPI001EFD4DFD|nr:hypothetical protein [Shewanella sp. Isolate11]MCG9696900.1 hypothetical protein [Shewanella sp. Isolate11]